MSVNTFIGHACMDYTDEDSSERYRQARQILKQSPEVAQADIYTASIVGDVQTVEELLNNDTSLATQKGGPKNWDALLYLCYSRVNSKESQHNTLEVAKLLLRNGADPNTRFTYPYGSIFTALTGAFGEGERGPENQPEHEYCFELAKVLLDADADPNDSQALYNRMFSPGNEVLELLLSYGLKASDKINWQENSETSTLDFLLGYAVKQNFSDRVALLLEHGADSNSRDYYNSKTHYENAIDHGHTQIADLLVKYGTKTEPAKK